MPWVKNRKLTKNPGAAVKSSGVIRFMVVLSRVEDPMTSAMATSSTG